MAELVPALALQQPRVGVCAALAGGSVGCDPPALAWGNALSHLLNVINVLWPGLAVSPAGEEGGRKGLSLAQCWEWPQDVLCCPQGMFTQLERPGGSLALSMWDFQRGFSERLFSFSLVWLGRKGKKKIQVTHGM